MDSQITDAGLVGEVDADVDADPDADDEATPKNPLAFLRLTGRANQWASWIAILLAIWILITAVSSIGDGFSTAVGDQAADLFQFATNPFVALAIGILATVATQSSSTTTSIVVGLAAGGLPMEIAIPMLIGANVGTTMTSTLVSVGMIGNKTQFRRAFSAATVHDFYNIASLVLIFPLELATGFLARSSEWAANAVSGEGTEGNVVSTAFTTFGDGVSAITSPGTDLIGWAVSPLQDTAAGIVQIVTGVALILLVIRFIGNMMKALMVGRAKRILHNAIGRGPISSVGSGTLITVIVQSSSTTTALVVPMAGSGAFSLKQIYPFTVGANIGTTLTALIASFAFTGAEGTLALQAALIHLFYNLASALVIFGIPFLRPIPLICASWLGKTVADRKILGVLWVLVVFLILPLLVIAISTLVS